MSGFVEICAMSERKAKFAQEDLPAIHSIFLFLLEGVIITVSQPGFRGVSLT